MSKNGDFFFLLFNSSGHIKFVCPRMYFLPKKRLFRMSGSLNLFTKLTQKMGGGLESADIADEGERGVGEMLTNNICL